MSNHASRRNYSFFTTWGQHCKTMSSSISLPRVTFSLHWWSRSIRVVCWCLCIHFISTYSQRHLESICLCLRLGVRHAFFFKQPFTNIYMHKLREMSALSLSEVLHRPCVSSVDKCTQRGLWNQKVVNLQHTQQGEIIGVTQFLSGPGLKANLHPWQTTVEIINDNPKWEIWIGNPDNRWSNRQLTCVDTRTANTTNHPVSVSILMLY